jgi:alkanesulfonate monooxygenase SsuD/methylene tetrahydromethanopterin reductase-like flavin-dependent oxidoreductase (luciferase family)
VIVKNATTIDQMSGGRLDLGVGTGWMDLEHDAFGIPFPDWPERWSRFEEALDYLDAAFGDDPARFTGTHYSLDANVRPKPTGMRTIIGGSGAKRTPTLAGNRADEYNFFLCPAETAREKIAVMRDAAGNRDVEATVMGPALVGRDETAYQERLDQAASRRGVSGDDLEQRYADNGYIVGTPKRVADSLAALEEAGVQRIYVQWLDLDDLDAMRETVSIVRGS